MNKFEIYLEAIQKVVQNELFNIDTSKISMKKIEDLGFDFFVLFKDIGAKPDLFSMNENIVLEMINEAIERNKASYRNVVIEEVIEENEKFKREIEKAIQENKVFKKEIEEAIKKNKQIKRDKIIEEVIIKNIKLFKEEIEEVINKNKVFKKEIEEVINKIINNDKDIMSPNKVELFIKTFNRLKNQNTYISQDQDFSNGGYYYFIINNKLYFLDLLQYGSGAPISIGFNEISDFSIASYNMNSIMSSSNGGTKLFGKIRGIIEKEISDWKKAIYYFRPVLEKKEEKPINNLNDLASSATDLFNSFIKGKILAPITLSKLKSSIKKLSSTRLAEIKTQVIEKINAQSKFDASIKQETIDFIEAIFSIKKLPVPSSNIIKIFKKTPQIYSTDLFDYVAMKEKNYESSARTRIYRIIIKQMFGSKVDIKQIGDTTYFSLAPIPDDPEALI